MDNNLTFLVLCKLASFRPVYDKGILNNHSIFIPCVLPELRLAKIFVLTLWLLSSAFRRLTR